MSGGGKQGGKQKPLKAPRAPKKEYDEVLYAFTLQCKLKRN